MNKCIFILHVFFLISITINQYKCCLIPRPDQIRLATAGDMAINVDWRLRVCPLEFINLTVIYDASSKQLTSTSVHDKSSSYGLILTTTSSSCLFERALNYVNPPGPVYLTNGATRNPEGNENVKKSTKNSCVVISDADFGILTVSDVSHATFGYILSKINIDVNAYKSYSQHQLWRLNVTTDEQVKGLTDLRRKAYESNINFWSEDIRINIPVDVSIGPKSIRDLHEYLVLNKIDYDVIMKDIGSLIDGQKLLHQLRPSNLIANDFAYDKYHPLDEIHSWIDTMVQTYPSLATSFIVG
ncbi:unnamed protein product, partial [Adineta ricciae]